MARDKGKRPAIDERSKQVFKRSKKSEGSSKGGGSSKRASDAPDSPIPVGMMQRFVSKEAYNRYTEHFINHKIIHEKPILVEKVPRNFIKQLGNMGLSSLITIPDVQLNETVVREFFANLNEKDVAEGHVIVRKKKVPFSSHVLNKALELRAWNDNEPDYKDELKELELEGKDPLERLRKRIRPETPWTTGANGVRKSISKVDWPENWRVRCRFIQCRLLPKYNVSNFYIEDLQMLYALAYGLKINVGRALVTEITSHFEKGNRCLVAPYLIHKLCREAKVPEYDSDHRLRRKPRGIQREKLRMKKLEEKGVGFSGEETGIPAAPLDPYKLQLTLATHHLAWFRTLRQNQVRLGKKLGVELIDTPFQYPKVVHDAIAQDAYELDEDSSSESGDSGSGSGDSDGSSDGGASSEASEDEAEKEEEDAAEQEAGGEEGATNAKEAETEATSEVPVEKTVDTPTEDAPPS